MEDEKKNGVFSAFLDGILNVMNRAEDRKQNVLNLQVGNQRRKMYYERIAHIMFEVAYCEVISYKKERMEMQNTKLSLENDDDRYGMDSFKYGPIGALTSSEDIASFKKTVQFELRDKLNLTAKVVVSPICIIVSFSRCG